MKTRKQWHPCRKLFFLERHVAPLKPHVRRKSFARNLFEGIRKHGHRDVHYISDKNKILQHLLRIIMPGDLVITLGAGDIYRVGEDLIEELGRKFKA